MWRTEPTDRCGRRSLGRGVCVGRRGLQRSLRQLRLSRSHRLQLTAEEIRGLENLPELMVWIDSALRSQQNRAVKGGTNSPLNSGSPPSPSETVDKQTTGQKQTAGEMVWAKQEGLTGREAGAANGLKRHTRLVSKNYTSLGFLVITST